MTLKRDHWHDKCLLAAIGYYLIMRGLQSNEESKKFIHYREVKNHCPIG